MFASDAMTFSRRPGWGFLAKNRTTTFTFWAANFDATFAALFGVSIMAIPAGSLGCPNAKWPGTKALASRPLVNVRLDTIDIAPPEELLPAAQPFCCALISPNLASARSNISLKSHIESRISRMVADVLARSALPKANMLLLRKYPMIRGSEIL